VEGFQDRRQRRPLALRPRHRAGAGERLDSTHARRHAAFGDDDEKADVPGRADVRAAAQTPG